MRCRRALNLESLVEVKPLAQGGSSKLHTIRLASEEREHVMRVALPVNPPFQDRN